MRRVFADTTFYQALFSRWDEWHDTATKLFGELAVEIVTTDYVLLELGALMSRGVARTIFIQFVERARFDESIKVISASPQLFEDGIALFAARPDKEWSLTDCISFVVMQQEAITDALTCDQHFAQAGFRALLVR